MTIHPTADVSKDAIIGKETSVWHQAQIREGVIIGSNCVIAKGVYLDIDLLIGDNVRIQNYASIYHFTTIEDDVFIGPYVCITNDKKPRAATSAGKPKKYGEWDAGKTTIKKGASLGAGTIVLPGLIIGEYSMIGAASLVTKDVLPQTLVYGSPATFKGFICRCGKLLSKEIKKPKVLLCNNCQKPANE